ncbi:hypothetical protein, partial [Duncaniella muris]|uniref:hypothetical protein n=1 Tax=Duncaniella muris TaxID=2094150 RepID=UPI0025B69918
TLSQQSLPPAIIFKKIGPVSAPHYVRGRLRAFSYQRSFNTLIPQKKDSKKQPHIWSSKKMSLTLHLQILDLFYNNWLKRFSVDFTRKSILSVL